MARILLPSKSCLSVPSSAEEALQQLELIASEHRQVVSRVFFSLLTILIMFLSVREPMWLSYPIIPAGGLPAILSSVVLGTLAVCSLIDVVINDVLPSQYRFSLDRRFRHYIWGGMSVTYLGYALIAVKTNAGLTPLFFLLLGIWAATIAVMDTFYEFRERILHVQH